MVLPEYLVEFEYLPNNSIFNTDNPEGFDISELERSELSSFKLSLNAFVDLCKSDHEIKHIKIDPKIPKRPIFDEITENILTNITKNLEIQHITHLNLSCNNICTIGPLKSLNNLERLSISFNLIHTIEELTNCYNLNYLDISHNKISTLDHIGDLGMLKTLHISHNLISDIRSLFSLDYNKELSILTMIGNPIASHSRYKQIILLSVPNIENLD